MMLTAELLCFFQLTVRDGYFRNFVKGSKKNGLWDEIR